MQGPLGNVVGALFPLPQAAEPAGKPEPARHPVEPADGVELWDRYNSHVRWVIAATSSIVIGNAAYDVAVSVHPQERVLLRQGIRVIREHVPKSNI